MGSAARSCSRFPAAWVRFCSRFADERGQGGFGGGLGLIAEGFRALLGTGEGALDAPVLNALVDAADEGEVGLDPLAGGVQSEGGGEIERHGDHQREDDGCAGQVEVVDQGVGP